MADTTAEFLIRGRADTRDAEAGLDRVEKKTERAKDATSRLGKAADAHFKAFTRAAESAQSRLGELDRQIRGRLLPSVSDPQWLGTIGKLSIAAFAASQAFNKLAHNALEWRKELNEQIAATRDLADGIQMTATAFNTLQHEQLSNAKRAQSAIEINDALSASLDGIGRGALDALQPFSDLEKLQGAATWDNFRRDMLAITDAVNLASTAYQASIDTYRGMSNAAEKRILEIYKEVTALQVLQDANAASALVMQIYADKGGRDVRKRGRSKAKPENPFDDALRRGALMGDIGPQAGMREDFDKRREQAELYRKEQEAMIPILERDMGDRQAILDIETRRAELALAESENEEIRFDREAEIERLRIEAIDLQISKTYELGARRELEFQKEIVQHQRRMRVKSFEESQEKKKQALIQDSMRAAVATGNAIIGISDMIGASDRAQAGMKAGLEGILGMVDFAAAATAYATLNIPQGVALTASGAMHVAAGIQAAAFAGSGGGHSGGRSMSMGPAFNPGGAGGSPNGGSGSGRPGLPGSAPGPSGGGGGSGGPHYHVHLHSLGVDDEETTILRTRKALQRAHETMGPV